MIGKTIDELKVGDAAEFAKTVSEADIYMYAGVTGDANPAHIDEVQASVVGHTLDSDEIDRCRTMIQEIGGISLRIR